MANGMLTNGTKEKIEDAGRMMRFLWPMVMALLATLLWREMVSIDASFRSQSEKIDMLSTAATRITTEHKNFSKEISDLERLGAEHGDRLRYLEITNGQSPRTWLKPDEN